MDKDEKDQRKKDISTAASSNTIERQSPAPFDPNKPSTSASIFDELMDDPNDASSKITRQDRKMSAFLDAWIDLSDLESGKSNIIIFDLKH